MNNTNYSDEHTTATILAIRNQISANFGVGFQFEQGKIFKEECNPRFKTRGFHFCLDIRDVKRFVPGCAKIVEVYAIGEVEGNGEEYCTNEIYIGKEIDNYDGM